MAKRYLTKDFTHNLKFILRIIKMSHEHIWIVLHQLKLDHLKPIKIPKLMNLIVYFKMGIAIS